MRHEWGAGGRPSWREKCCVASNCVPCPVIVDPVRDVQHASPPTVEPGSR